MACQVLGTRIDIPPALVFSLTASTADMAAVKRDYDGKARARPAADAPPGRFHDMFAHFRDELDEHHDRRERIVKASRDVTAQSKKM